MQEEILKICEEICGTGISVNEQLIVEGLLDSYGIMELISDLENKFNISFLPEEITDLNNFSSISHILGIVKKKVSSI